MLSRFERKDDCQKGYMAGAKIQNLVIHVLSNDCVYIGIDVQHIAKVALGDNK